VLLPRLPTRLGLPLPAPDLGQAGLGRDHTGLAVEREVLLAGQPAKVLVDEIPVSVDEVPAGVAGVELDDALPVVDLIGLLMRLLPRQATRHEPDPLQLMAPQ